MSLPGLFLTLVLIAILALWIASPLLSRRANRQTDHTVQQEYERVVVNYERILINIRDLDEDFATGKIGESDYQAERETWIERGIALLRSIDALTEQHGLNNAAPTIEDDIEARIAAHRARTTKAAHD